MIANRRARILHVIGNLSAGGAEKMVVTAVNLLADRGHDVGLALLIDGGPLCDHLNQKVQVHFLNRKSRFDWGALLRFSELCNQYDFIHVHLKHNFKYVFVATCIRRIRVPIILHDHSAEVLTTGVQRTNLPFFVVSWLRRQTYVGVSKQLVEWAIQNFRLNASHCFVLPNSIPLPEAVEKDFPGMNDGKLRLILVSNFRRIKNIEFAVKLLKELVDEDRKVSLDIFGQALDKDYFSEIENLIEELGLSANVTIHENVSNISVFLNKYDLGIHCSRAETGPLVLLEFLAAGLPFVTSNCGDVVEKVYKRFPEFVVSEFSLTLWAVRVAQIDTRAYKGDLRTFLENEFSIDEYYKDLNSLYSQVSRDN